MALHRINGTWEFMNKKRADALFLIVDSYFKEYVDFAANCYGFPGYCDGIIR